MLDKKRTLSSPMSDFSHPNYNTFLHTSLENFQRFVSEDMIQALTNGYSFQKTGTSLNTSTEQIKQVMQRIQTMAWFIWREMCVDGTKETHWLHYAVYSKQIASMGETICFITLMCIKALSINCTWNLFSGNIVMKLASKRKRGSWFIIIIIISLFIRGPTKHCYFLFYTVYQWYNS